MKERDYSLDLLRVISMFLVIVIHMSNYYCRAFAKISEVSYLGAAFWNAVARVAVPIFFMISGALLIKEDYNKGKYKKRIFTYIGILVFWNIIYYLWNVFYLNTSVFNIKNLIEAFFVPTKRHLWFMYAIIGIYIILPFIQSMFKNLSEELKKLYTELWLILCGAVFVITLILKSFNINASIIYPIPLIQNVYYLGYFIVGHIMYEYINKVKNKNNKIYLTLYIISTLVLIVSTYFLSIKLSKYYESMFAYRSIFMMLSSISVFYLIIGNKNIILNDKLIKILNLVSPYSFGVYLTHVLFLNILTENIKVLNIISFIGIPAFSILLFVFSFVLVYIIKKIPYFRKLV